MASWHHNEKVVEHARSRGVKLSIWFGASGINRQYWSYGPRDNPDDRRLGPLQELFIRYLLARWGPESVWWHWTVDSEYEETGPGALERVRAFAAELRARNPWRTLVTTHVLGDWSSRGAPEFDVVTLQRRVADSDDGATACRAFVEGAAEYRKPIFNAEGVWNVATATRARVATWTHLMAGGHSMIAHYDPARPDDHLRSSWGVTWETVSPRHREDAAMAGRLARFWNGTLGVDISRALPRGDLVRLRGGHLALCLADPGRTYLVWLDRGGDVSLDLRGLAGAFSTARYRCGDLEHPVALEPVAGGEWRALGSAPSEGFGQDWLIVVRR